MEKAESQISNGFKINDGGKIVNSEHVWHRNYQEAAEGRKEERKEGVMRLEAEREEKMRRKKRQGK